MGEIKETGASSSLCPSGLGVTRFALSNFRSHDFSCVQLERPENVFVIGENGAGKTNFLEALSLFAPGRGLKKALPKKWQSKHREDPWSLALSLKTEDGCIGARIRSAVCHKSSRDIFFNERRLKTQVDLQDYLQVLWITPGMDLLFCESMLQRRRFFDRLVMGFDKSYAPCLLSYEKALAEWRRLLDQGVMQSAWISSLEKILAAQSKQVIEKRFAFLSTFLEVQKIFGIGRSMPSFSMKGVLESAFCQGEDLLDAARLAFEKERFNFQRYKSIKVGPQATKFFCSLTGVAIEQCSTGQQKRALYLLILGACAIQKRRMPYRPLLLLLDEPAAHLDAKAIDFLYRLFETQSNLQIWTTTTDESVFSAFEGKRFFLKKQTLKEW